jgi:pimeloyl-ACP methyl ester carboxylesterase
MGSGRWFRLIVGLVLLVVPAWALFSRLDATWNGHPAYPTTLLVTAGGGLMLIAFALYPWRRDPEPNGPPWEADERAADQRAADEPGSAVAHRGRPSNPAEHRRRTRRIAGRIVAATLALLLVGFLFWLRPFQAGPDALAALRSDGGVSVLDTPTTIEISPIGTEQPTVGLVFSPGARVDARAYAALLRPIAEAGNLVVILKEPFGLAITQVGQAATPIADHPEISTWAVGGHSLGGVSAASFAAENSAQVSGLLLWASYPNGDLSGTTLQVESISGSNDGLTTQADIEQSRARLPPDATFTVIDGGVHGFFADYGEQPGDGQPTIDRAAASAQIIAASTAFLGRLDEPVPTG